MGTSSQDKQKYPCLEPVNLNTQLGQPIRKWTYYIRVKAKKRTAEHLSKTMDPSVSPLKTSILILSHERHAGTGVRKACGQPYRFMLGCPVSGYSFLTADSQQSLAMASLSQMR